MWIPSPSSPGTCRVALCLKSLVALMASDAASPATYRAIHVLAHGFSPTPQLHKILEVSVYLSADSRVAISSWIQCGPILSISLECAI